MPGRPELAFAERYASNSRRSAQRHALRSLIEECFAQSTAEQVIARLGESRIANALMNDMHAVRQHLQLRSRERRVEIDTPAGPMPALLPPGRSNALAPRMDPVPALGQHTDAILLEIGLSSAEIEVLRVARVIQKVVSERRMTSLEARVMP